MAAIVSVRSTAFAALVLMSGAALAAQVHAQDVRKVTIRFAPMVGGEPFVCGKSYDGIGATGSRVTPSDFRFYVSDVELVDQSGKPVPLKLDQDERWQHQNVALLDFENRSGPCLTGTQEMRDVVAGTVPAGH